MQSAKRDPRFLMSITEDPQSGEYDVTLPALGLTQHGTFDEVSAWALEQLALQAGLTPASEDASQADAQGDATTH